MASIVGLNHLSEALIDAGNRLLSPHSSTDELLTLLDETESLLRKVEQDQPLSMQNALIPSKNALVSSGLLSHSDSDVRVSVVSCLTEILRITAPQAPYTDDKMKEIFRLTIEAFEKLADSSSRSYQKAESVLDNMSKVKSCLVMLDLECDDLILQMFRIFLRIIRSDHPRVVFSSMEMIMITVLDEIEEVSRDFLDTLLASVQKDNQNVLPMAWSLAEKVLSRCARKLKPYIMEALKSTRTSLDTYSPVVTTICQTVFESPKVRNVVDTKQNEDKLVLGHSRKETRSKSGSKKPARDGTRRINVHENLSKGKQVWSESRDAETDLGVTGKRGRKPNSLMNPEEGYDIPCLSGKRDYLKTCSSNKKLQRKGSGGESSLEKLASAAKKTPPKAKESSPATTSRALTGSVKRSRVKMEDIDHDLDSPSSPKLKKLASCFRDEEPLEKESNQESYEIPEDDAKIGESSKKAKSQNGGKKKAIVNSTGNRSSARTAAKKKTVEGASSDTLVPQSSNDKKKKSQVEARPLAEESEETSKSHSVRSRTARKEVESDTNGFGEDLVGKRVKVWWPLDKTFYEGVIDSYSKRNKTHRVAYTDGEPEELNLAKERWELLEDLPSASEKNKSQVSEESEEIEETSKSQLTRSRTAKRQVGGFGEDLVGKRVNIWWPLDKTFYEGVVESYSSRKKMHRVVYTDGESEQLNLAKERWELLDDLSSASEEDDEQDMEIDLPESIPLFDIMQKVKKSKNVEVSSKKDSGKKARVEGKNLKSLKELSAKTERREEQEVSRDVDEESEDEYYNSEMLESEENLKLTETEAEEEEKQFKNPEVESEGDGSESEEEPKWRETDDMEDEEAEEEADDKVPKSTSLSETEKDADEERGS